MTAAALPAPARTAVRRVATALPTMLRVAVAEAVAYRSEMIVWLFAYTTPLIMMALWTAAAREAPFGRFGVPQLQAYFLAMLVVRFSTGTWIIWEMNWEIRQGTLSRRLLKPIHPLLAYACENFGALPLRTALMLPVAVTGLALIGTGAFTHDPVVLALWPLTLVGAWLMLFSIQAILGTLGLYIESSLQVGEVWMGVYMAFSGYLVPVSLFPPALKAALQWLPFWWMLGFPVETVLGLRTRAEVLHGLAVQAAYGVILMLAMGIVWRWAVRRFAAYGG